MKLHLVALSLAVLVAAASAGYIGGSGGWSSPVYYSRSYAPSYGGWSGYGGYGNGWHGGYSGYGGYGGWGGYGSYSGGYGGGRKGWNSGWW